MEGLPEVHHLHGQGLVPKGVAAGPEPPGPGIAGDGEAGLAAQGPPSLMEGEGPGHMAQPEAQISVGAEDQQGGHDPESLALLHGGWGGASEIP